MPHAPPEMAITIPRPEPARFTRPVSLRMCPRQWEQIERVAAENGVPAAAVVRELLERCLSAA